MHYVKKNLTFRREISEISSHEQRLSDRILSINVQSKVERQTTNLVQENIYSIDQIFSPKTKILNFHRMMAKRMVLGDKILFLYSYRNTAVGRISSARAKSI